MLLVTIQYYSNAPLDSLTPYSLGIVVKGFSFHPAGDFEDILPYGAKNIVIHHHVFASCCSPLLGSDSDALG